MLWLLVAFWLESIVIFVVCGALCSVVFGACLYITSVVSTAFANVRRCGVFVVDVFSPSSVTGHDAAAKPTTVAIVDWSWDDVIVAVVFGLYPRLCPIE